MFIEVTVPRLTEDTSHTMAASVLCEPQILIRGCNEYSQRWEVTRLPVGNLLRDVSNLSLFPGMDNLHRESISTRSSDLRFVSGTPCVAFVPRWLLGCPACSKREFRVL
uniref:Uncharacterized protein n=1 Tax=Sphaerodactylus townsendi TaxID=933632 RepID=A0ACB8G6U0_9SAUR